MYNLMQIVKMYKLINYIFFSRQTHIFLDFIMVLIYFKLFFKCFLSFSILKFNLLLKTFLMTIFLCLNDNVK